MLNPYVYSKKANRAFYASRANERRKQKGEPDGNDDDDDDYCNRSQFDAHGFLHSYRLERASEVVYRVPSADRKRVLRMLQTISNAQMTRTDIGHDKRLLKAVKVADRKFKRALASANPIAFDTRLKFSGGVHCLTTPPLDQITQMYMRSLNTLFKKYDVQTVNAPPSQSTGTLQLPNEMLKSDVKKMFNAELVQGSMKEQLQGGKSKTKQVAFPGKVVLQMRATVLPADASVALDEIVLPRVMFDTIAPYSGDCCVTCNRYPIISVNSIKVFTRFKRCACPDGSCFCHCVHISSELLADGNIDMDGDCLLVVFSDGTIPMVEAIVNLHPKFKMYRGLGHITATMAQPITVRFQQAVYRQLFLRYCYCRPESSEVDRRICDALSWLEKYCGGGGDGDGSVQSTKLLAKALLFFTEYCGSNTAMHFIDMLRRVCLDDDICRYDACLVADYSADDPTIAAILDSGTKGCRELMNEILTKRPLTDINSKCMKFLRDHQNSSKSISTVSTSLTRLSLSTQNLIINHNFNVVCLEPYGEEIVLGSIVDICDPVFLMSDATADCFFSQLIR